MISRLLIIHGDSFRVVEPEMGITLVDAPLYEYAVDWSNGFLDCMKMYATGERQESDPMFLDAYQAGINFANAVCEAGVEEGVVFQENFNHKEPYASNVMHLFE